MTKNELIAALEAATGPNRVLDVAVCPYPTRVGEIADWLYEDPCFPGDWSRVPRYTASIDAALALVPEGWKVNLSTEKNASFKGFAAHAWVKDRDWPDPCSGDGSIAEDGHASTIPLALCIAALRASP